MKFSDGFLWEQMQAFVYLKLVGNLLHKVMKTGCSLCNLIVDWALSTVQGVVGWLEEMETSGGLFTRLMYGLLRRPASRLADVCETIAAWVTWLIRWIEELLVEPEVPSCGHLLQL